MSNYPESLLTADALELYAIDANSGDPRIDNAAICLRRQHAEIERLRAESNARAACVVATQGANERLRAECDALRAELDAMTARAREAENDRQDVFDSYTDACNQLVETEIKCDALRADAERYRWLRVRNEDGVDPSGPFVVIGDDGNVDYPSGAKIDAAIDAAREAGK